MKTYYKERKISNRSFDFSSKQNIIVPLILDINDVLVCLPHLSCLPIFHLLSHLLADQILLNSSHDLLTNLRSLYFWTVITVMKVTVMEIYLRDWDGWRSNSSKLGFFSNNPKNYFQKMSYFSINRKQSVWAKNEHLKIWWAFMYGMFLKVFCMP